MSALTFAEGILKEFVARYPAAPTPQWAQLGPPIMTCTSTAVGAIASSEEPLLSTGRVGLASPGGNARCGVIPNHTIMIVLAHECGVTFDQDGHTVPSKAVSVSRILDADGEALAAYLLDLAQAGHVLGLPQTTYLNEGGLAATSLTAIITEL